jgi:CheY-like chemotaxis protein
MERILRDGGASVVTASSASEALAILPRLKPNLLVSDIGMPGEDGYDLIGKVRALSRNDGGATPAVALTAFVRSEDRQRVLRSGYQMHVAKPLEPSELLIVCAGLVGRTGLPFDAFGRLLKKSNAVRKRVHRNRETHRGPSGRRIFPNAIPAYDLRRRLALEPVERNATPLRPSDDEAPSAPRASLLLQARHLVLGRSMPRSWG